MFGWFKKSNDNESQFSIGAIQHENEITTPQNPIKFNDILLLEKSENWREMIAKCVVWANQQPSNPLPYFSSGNAHRKIGKPVAAVAMYRKAIEVSNQPNDLLPSSFFSIAQCWYGLGHAYFQLKERDEAENAFIQAASIEPGVPDIWNDLGVIYLNLQPYDTKKAFNAFEKAIQVDPKNVQALTNLGIVYAICGMEDQVNMIHRELLPLARADAERFLKVAKDKLHEVKARSK